MAKDEQAKIKRFADYREDGEPGAQVYVSRIETKIFDTIAEAAEFLGMEGTDLLDYLEGTQN